MYFLFGMLLAILYLLLCVGAAAACAVVLYLCGRFVLEPGWLYLSHKIQVEPKIQLFEVNDFLPLAKSVLRDPMQALKATGFQQQASLWMERSDSTQLYVVVMRQPTTHDMALVKAVYRHQFDYLELVESHLEFHSELENGRTVRTSNTALLSPFGAQAHATETLLPKVQEPHELHQAHRLFCAQACPPHGLPHSSAEWQQEDAIAYLQRVSREENVAWKERDLVTLDRESNLLRLTYKGACLMSWGQLPPVSKIRRILQQNAADHRMESLDATRAASTCQRGQNERLEELASAIGRIRVGGSGQQ